jgi:hypothetical protein
MYAGSLIVLRTGFVGVANGFSNRSNAGPTPSRPPGVKEAVNTSSKHRDRSARSAFVG